MKSPVNRNSLELQFADQIESWQRSSLLTHSLNADLSQRVIALAQKACWQSCPLPNTEIRLLEYRGGENPRFTAILRIQKSFNISDLGLWRKLEMLVLSGALGLADQVALGGSYIRVPDLEHTLCLNHGPIYWPLEGHLYVAYAGGNYTKDDTEPRLIDTRADEVWLPGPTEGTEVLPLHVHGRANAMLVRWNQTATFQPQLDPQGEEILVLKGSLADEHGRYSAGTWIRNPEITWQHWSGTEDTVVFYKTGHFYDVSDHVAEDDDRTGNRSTNSSANSP